MGVYGMEQSTGMRKLPQAITRISWAKDKEPGIVKARVAIKEPSQSTMQFYLYEASQGVKLTEREGRMVLARQGLEEENRVMSAEFHFER